MVRKAEASPPVTMRHIRGHGCRDLLVYCDSGRCHHSATLSGDRFPDDMPVRSLCRRMACTCCGMIGADVRPDWSPHGRGCRLRQMTQQQNGPGRMENPTTPQKPRFRQIGGFPNIMRGEVRKGSERGCMPIL
jgi:hypothetical protein